MYFVPSVTVTFSETSSTPLRNPALLGRNVVAAATRRPAASAAGAPSRHRPAGRVARPDGDARSRDRHLDFLGGISVSGRP